MTLEVIYSSTCGEYVRLHTPHLPSHWPVLLLVLLDGLDISALAGPLQSNDHTELSGRSMDRE